MPAALRSWRFWLPAVLGTLAVASYLLHARYFSVYVNDDAYITFRYSLFTALGRGPCYNLGEHVEGYTNFLLMLIIAAVIKLGGPDAAPPAAKLIGVSGGLLALLASWALCTRWLRRLASVSSVAPLLAVAAPALVAANVAYALNSMSGLETTLFAGWVTLGLYLLEVSRETGRWRAAGVAFALAALTRPEGIMVFAAALAGRALSGPWARKAWRIPSIDVALVALVVCGHLAFRFVTYDGELVPNTYHAKAGGMRWSVDAGKYIWSFAWLHAGGVSALVALLALLGRKQMWRATLPSLLVCTVAMLSIYKTGPDWMLGGRLLVPYVPLWAALAACGVVATVDRVASLVSTRQSTVPWIGGVLCLALVVGVGWQNQARVGYRQFCEVRTRGYLNGHTALADWLNAQATPGDTVALMDIGIIGYRNPNLRILDITGLTDRFIAKSPGDFLSKRYDPGYVLDQGPAFIVLVMSHLTLPDGRVVLAGWTQIERDFQTHPEFVAHYHRPQTPDRQTDKLTWTAAALGCERVFQHEYPGDVYLLAVYQRQQ